MARCDPGRRVRRPPPAAQRGAECRARQRIRRVVVRPFPWAPSRGILAAGPLVFPCALGRAGVTRFKREGDGATPAGKLPVLAVLWRRDRSLPPRAPVTPCPIRRDDGWCDDPLDGRYNRPMTLPAQASHERLLRDDGLYDAVVVLDWNFSRRAPGRGSAIFLHAARADLAPTAGCVALAPSYLRRLLARLAPRAVLVIG